MTHRYTLLVGGTVISGPDHPIASAIAWAEGTVIGLGSDDEVRGMSRGDSHLIDLGGASVVALAEGRGPCWPVDATLEVGGRADLAVLDRDPRESEVTHVKELSALAVIRGGRVVAGELPGEAPGGHSASPPRRA